METLFKCPICGNDNPHKIGYKNGKPYCRACITFRGEEAKWMVKYPKQSFYRLDYNLSKEQQELSNQLVLNYKKGKNSLVHAVCGSGKTEIVLEVIAYAMRCGERVGFAVPRRDVVVELFMRFKQIFKQNKITLVFGGHTEELEGDLICLTTHQLFRYDHYFDLLVLDEIDAFPFKGNDVLNAFFQRSLSGRFVMMSATPSDELILEFKKQGTEVLELFSRFHKKPLPIPENIIHRNCFLYWLLIKEMKKFIKNKMPVFVFAPTIEECENLFTFLHLFFKKGNCVHSKKESRMKTIEDFRKGKYQYLVTTAVLERGVTIKNLQVVVFHSNHEIYDSYSLVQIAGRVGRKIDAPEGRVIFFANELTKDMQRAVDDIKTANKSLQNMLSTD